ncbi:MAG: hypothetical protein U9Q22_02230 [Candidatus Altiarchaeota archaeon]|nr:hypothetical protein [Candidatus Altiarchaeota archaeon]
MKADVYLREVLKQTPRLLSLLDRNPLSKTYGCFDRQYWHYTVIDFPCARSQEAALTLALLYSIDHEMNIYYKNKSVLDWINAALKFWTRIQEGNGSFNEWYPNENSLVATAFSSYAISETLLLLGDEIKGRDEVISSLKKAAKWLMKKDEDRAVNQGTGAAVFLYNIFLLTGDEEYRKSSEKKIGFILSKQDKEGWFPEYGGADIGYLSLAIDYLSKYYKKSNNRRILKHLKDSVEFISFFIQQNHLFGGIYGSRNTSYLIPHGFEILSREIPTAALISGCIRKALESKKAVSPHSLDDRYLTYITYTNLQAYVDSGDTGVGHLPNQQEFVRNLPNSGFWIYGDKHIYLVTNYKKGGVFSVFFKESNTLFQDSGIMLETLEGEGLTSSWLTDRNTVELHGNRIEVQGSLWNIPSNYLSPVKSVFLRTFQMTVGRNASVGQAVKNALRDRLITKTKQTSIHFSREICIEGGLLKIRDEIDALDKVKELFIGGDVSHTYTPSSRYFQNPELNSNPIKFDEIARDKVEIMRVYDIEGKPVNQGKKQS